MTDKTTRCNVPAFNSEADEAKWWDANMDMVEAELIKAIDQQTYTRGNARRLSSESKNITIRIAVADIERARSLAAKKGIGYQTYLKILLHEALEAASRKAL